MQCDTGAYCPASSSHQLPLIPLWVLVVVDAVVLLMVLGGYIYSKYRGRRRSTFSRLSSGAEIDDIELLRKTSPSPAQLESEASLGLLRPRAASVIKQPEGTTVALFEPDTPSDHTRMHSPSLSMSGYSAHDSLSLDDVQNPDMLRFLDFLSRAMHTKEIGLSFEFDKLSFETPKGHKKILSDITGSMPKGSMWGIMGGSGAGKSTFVNVLMGKHRASSGIIRINGWVADMTKYKKLIGYVPQDDVVLPDLTVRENIMHSARMRLPSSWKDQTISEFVDALIGSLALSHVQHSLVGCASKPVISGGQRKRVSIGMELAAAPMAIFLDEPTSGLDATSAASIMRLLKAISHLGVTVISIIHQPREDIWRGFDQLLLLAQGSQVYSGETEQAVSYFENLGYDFPTRANPADIIMDIITGHGEQKKLLAEKHQHGVRYLIDFWQTRGQYGRKEKHLSVDVSAERMWRMSNQSIQSTVEQERALCQTQKTRGATWIAQAYYCTQRAMVQQVRNKISFLFEIGVGGLAGLVIGLSAYSSAGNLFQGIYHPPFTVLSSAVDYNSIPQLGLLSAMAIGLAGSAPGVWVFGEEKMIFYRESASGHSRSAYYLGKVISTIPRIGLSALHYTVFVGLLATPLMSFSQMYAANLMYFYTIYGGASIVSMVVKREDGPLLAVLASLVIGVLGGVSPPLSKVKSWHMEWFWRISPSVWFTEAYFSQNLLPLDHLYVLDAASSSIGFTLGRYTLDIL